MENDFIENPAESSLGANNQVDKEQKILKFWQENKIFKKLCQKNKGKKPWSFLDGPITANNPMGVHHAWGRTYKDMFQRYKAMQGFDERFQNGFDCQGLWVEVEVEKELGFKNKKDIEKYGIERFVQKCKERVFKYSKIQTEQSIRLGQWMDWENSYYTMSDENNYAIWHFLKKCHEKGLLYKGRDVVPWCPRCGTAISQHEILTEEYKEITHKAVYVKFPVKGQSKTYFLAWTTTPWTLPANVFLSVHPDLPYIKIKDQNGDIYILLKEKANLIVGGKIVEEFEGKNLEGWRYVGPFDDLGVVRTYLSDFDTKNKDIEHKVFLWKGVNQEEGTGIVHSAPGCGKEDFELSKEHADLFYINPMDPKENESRYDKKQDFGFLSGELVYSDKTRNAILENLKDKEIDGQRYNFVYKIEDYKHRYPTCWRCKTELIFRLVDEWYIAMALRKGYLSLRNQLIESVKKINWIPSFCLERELDWLNNMQDWLISKKRYWGLALPIWECECGNFEVIGSKQDLERMVKEVEGGDAIWKEFKDHSPHRPWIDKVKIKCSKCGKIISRIFDVGNPWLDAGIVPFSTISDDNRSENIPYFHNRKEEWQKWFPVELVCESFPGQFKNWFYVLLVMSQVLEGKPPFKNLLGFATVVDEKGEEMHKSKGNAIWFDEAVEKIGADVMRWMYVKQNPIYNLRFGYNVARETKRKLLTFWNCYTFLGTYVPKKEFSIFLDRAKRETPRRVAFQFSNNFQLSNFQNVLDRWTAYKLNRLVKEVTESLDRFDAMRASNSIEDFFINDLSLWYIRRSRKRLQNPESEQEKQEAGQILYYVLLTLTKLIAPMMPFLAETVYQELKSDSDPESVHLCDWPDYDEKLIDGELEEQMMQVREIVSLALAKRAELGVKVRQPLSCLKIYTPTERDLELDVLSGEVYLPGGGVKYEAGRLRRAISTNRSFLELIIGEVNVEEVIFTEKIKGDIELDATISDELKEEGMVREIIRHIQDLRKRAGLIPKDRVLIHYSTEPELGKILEKNKSLVLETTKSNDIEENLARKGVFDKEKELKLDSEKIWLAIKKVEE